MDDFSEKLSGILSDPATMNRIREMAGTLLNEEKEEKNDIPDGIDISKIISVLGRLKSAGGGEREKLLLALRPHLKEERQKRVDTAVRILKLIEIAPLLKDSGIFG